MKPEQVLTPASCLLSQPGQNEPCWASLPWPWPPSSWAGPGRAQWPCSVHVWSRHIDLQMRKCTATSPSAGCREHTEPRKWGAPGLLLACILRPPQGPQHGWQWLAPAGPRAPVVPGQGPVVPGQVKARPLHGAEMRGGGVRWIRAGAWLTKLNRAP